MSEIRVRRHAEPVVATPRDAARRFGLRGTQIAETPTGLLPFAIHNRLVRRDTYENSEFTAVAFEVNGHEFFWLNRPSSQTWEKVGLRGHRVVETMSGRHENLRAALEIIGTRPQALDLVRAFITTFAWVESDGEGSGEPLLTSCSLPDLPLIAFISDMADRHIPPLTVAPVGSPRLLAENIYHESVHQLVNFRILSEQLFVPEYDSRTSPRVPIGWRRSSIKRNQEWELDRVLHAASVYVQLLDWRLHELEYDQLSDIERAAIEEAALASLESATYLTQSLCEYVDWFTPSGALFVGRLAQSADQRARALSALLGVELVS